MSSKRIITELESRVEQLIADHRRLSTLCQSLRGERDTLLEQRRVLQESQREQQRQLSVLQLRDGLGASTAQSNEDRDRARARVNQLMREVDRCIGLLSTVEE